MSVIVITCINQQIFLLVAIVVYVVFVVFIHFMLSSPTHGIFYTYKRALAKSVYFPFFDLFKILGSLDSKISKMTIFKFRLPCSY